MLAGDVSDLYSGVLAATGGTTAPASHTVKLAIRLGVNTSPEPATNIAVSTAEDVTVASVVSLALVAPWVAAGIAAVLLVAGVVIVVLLAARIRRARTHWRERRSRPA